jgi:hypothetical protein
LAKALAAQAALQLPRPVVTAGVEAAVQMEVFHFRLMAVMVVLMAVLAAAVTAAAVIVVVLQAPALSVLFIRATREHILQQMLVNHEFIY